MYAREAVLTSPEPAHPRDGFGDHREQFHLYFLSNQLKTFEYTGEGILPALMACA